MFNKFLSYAAASLVLASCSSTDVLEENIAAGTAISFSSHVTNSSRAVTSDNLEKFQVYGGYTTASTSDYHTVFNAVAVSKDGDGSWTYEGSSKYWVEGGTYKFYAYSCENVALEKGTPSFSQSGPDAGTFKISDFECSNGHQHDLVYASTNAITAKGTGNSKVSLNFKHILSKVNAKFKSGFPSDFTVEISEAEFRNIYDKANFSSSNELWSGQSRTIEYNAAENKWTSIALPVTGDDKTIQAGKPAEGSDPAVAAKDLTTGPAFFLPVTYSENNVTLSFKIVVKQGDETIKTDYVKGNLKPEWAIGTSYTYNVTINGSAAGVEKIEFEVDASNGVQDWTTSPDVDFNIGA
ncbi:fimbrillin family protein [uncultured Duncaniella sp.]|uniref:fimbrillin family protein n=1 Tax=uncultured Duncaniella sp. TaxID=2768039 RepID=UPI0026758A3E|nr:fimbrillin family protein [uncultured Duncaniella sp.]